MWLDPLDKIAKIKKSCFNEEHCTGFDASLLSHSCCFHEIKTIFNTIYASPFYFFSNSHVTCNELTPYQCPCLWQVGSIGLHFFHMRFAFFPAFAGKDAARPNMALLY